MSLLSEGGPFGEDGKEVESKPAKGKGGKASAKAKGGDEDGDGSSGEYAIENAKSSRSTCKSCNEKIEKGQVHELWSSSLLGWQCLFYL